MEVNNVSKLVNNLTIKGLESTKSQKSPFSEAIFKGASKVQALPFKNSFTKTASSEVNRVKSASLKVDLFQHLYPAAKGIDALIAQIEAKKGSEYVANLRCQYQSARDFHFDRIEEGEQGLEQLPPHIQRRIDDLILNSDGNDYAVTQAILHSLKERITGE